MKIGAKPCHDFWYLPRFNHVEFSPSVTIVQSVHYPWPGIARVFRCDDSEGLMQL